jgi:hypothetical protein
MSRFRHKTADFSDGTGWRVAVQIIAGSLVQGVDAQR